MGFVRSAIGAAVIIFYGLGAAAQDASPQIAAEQEADPGPASGPGELSYTVLDGSGAAPLLEEYAADIERGREIVVSDELGGCLRCHKLEGVGGLRASSQAPDLDGVGGRLGEASLRLWVVNPGMIRAEPGMPAYYSLFEPSAPAGRSLLTAQQIEDVVIFLKSLNEDERGAQEQ